MADRRALLTALAASVGAMSTSTAAGGPSVPLSAPLADPATTGPYADLAMEWRRGNAELERLMAEHAQLVQQTDATADAGEPSTVPAA